MVAMHKAQATQDELVAPKSDLPRVLVVDDEKEIREILRRTLCEEFAVTATERPVEAISLLEGGEKYVAAVCDLSMPEMSGVDLLRRMRECDPGIPVIILTGNGSLESAMAVMEHGGFRYLTKPFQESGLLEAVRAASATRQIDTLRRRALEIYDSGLWQKGTNQDEDRHFDEALENAHLVFQPIVDATSREVFGYEALIRSDGPKLTNPGLLFGAAERLGRVRDIGRKVRRMAAQRFETAPQGATLFVNLHALDLGDHELYASTAPLSRIAKHVVLEITERMSLDSLDDLSARMRSLRDLGYRIAVDDLGAGYAGLTSFSQLAPEVVKLDMSLIRGLDQDQRKRSIVKSMLTVCQRDLDTRVVCEGVETEREHASLLELGADLVQGYYFGRPMRDFPEP